MPNHTKGGADYKGERHAYKEELLKTVSTYSVRKPSDSKHIESAGLNHLDQKLMLAIMFNTIEDIEMLLEVGANPNAVNKKGFSVLELALAHGRDEKIMDMLRSYGAETHESHVIKSAINKPK